MKKLRNFLSIYEYFDDPMIAKKFIDDNEVDYLSKKYLDNIKNPSVAVKSNLLSFRRGAYKEYDKSKHRYESLSNSAKGVYDLVASFDIEFAVKYPFIDVLVTDLEKSTVFYYSETGENYSLEIFFEIICEDLEEGYLLRKTGHFHIDDMSFFPKISKFEIQGAKKLKDTFFDLFTSTMDIIRKNANHNNVGLKYFKIKGLDAFNNEIPSTDKYKN